MNTIVVRNKALNDALINFEKANDNSPQFIIGFYAALIKHLAVDKITDYTYAVEILRRNTK